MVSGKPLPIALSDSRWRPDTYDYPLPPGATWKGLFRKHSRPNLIRDWKSGAWKSSGPSQVFFHRSGYNRARAIGENSASAIKNGYDMGGYLLEVDVWFSKDGHPILAHDRTVDRVTLSKGNWCDYTIAEIRAMIHVQREIDGSRLSNRYVPLDEPICELETQLELYKNATFMVDMRDNRAGQMIDWVMKHLDYKNQIIVKFYNFKYNDFLELDQDAQASGAPSGWEQDVVIMPILHEKPVMQLAQNEAQQLDMAGFESGPDDDVTFDPKAIRRIAHRFVNSFLHPDQLVIALEFSINGLGLHYTYDRGEARHPIDGSEITNDTVRGSALVDRIFLDMIGDIRLNRPDCATATCIRTFDVKVGEMKAVFDLATGELDPLPTGQRGIASELRAMPGGFYPTHAIVNADNPKAVLATLAWYEAGHAKPARLKTMFWDQWIMTLDSDDAREAVMMLTNEVETNVFSG
jgi:glycerophosphoryl diester phosphodiesterase